MKRSAQKLTIANVLRISQSIVAIATRLGYSEILKGRSNYARMSGSTSSVNSPLMTSGSAMAEEPRDALVSRNSATTKYPYRMALFA